MVMVSYGTKTFATHPQDFSHCPFLLAVVEL